MHCCVKSASLGTQQLYVFTIFFIGITVTIVSNPAGTPVSGSANTFDYPILSSITLTCRATASDGSTLIVTNYQWDTTGCYTNPAHSSGNPTCFPTGQTTQNVTGNDLTAKDAGTITCTATISSVDYTSGPLILRISGIHLCITIKPTMVLPLR